MIQRFIIFLLRHLVSRWGGLGLRIANAVRIRKSAGWLLDREVVTSYRGVRFRVNCLEWQGFLMHIGQCAEYPLAKFVESWAVNCRVFFDVGANLGSYGLFVKRANPQAKVISFEPDPRVYAQLMANLQLNPDLSNVIPLPFALADKSGPRKFEIPDDFRNLGVGSLMCSGLSQKKNIWVPCYSISDAADFLGVWPDLLKVDVEGGEGLVLQGFADAFQNGRPKPDFIIELHPWMDPRGREAYLEEMTGFFRDWKYETGILEEGSGRLVRVDIGTIPDRAFLIASTHSGKLQFA